MDAHLHMSLSAVLALALEEDARHVVYTHRQSWEKETKFMTTTSYEGVGGTSRECR